jgi:hypothetical protein
MSDELRQDGGTSSLLVGEKVTAKGSTLTVTELDLASLPALRAHLIEIAGRCGTTTYGALKADLGLRHAVNGFGRLLDLLGEDCARRAEPSLSALVVTQRTGEVGTGADRSAEQERAALYDRWRMVSDDPADHETKFVLNGRAMCLSAATVRTRVRPNIPDVVRTHWVEIDGRTWPPKQAFRIAMGFSDEPFISHFAIRVFRRLGFVTSLLPDESTVSGVPTPAVGPAPVPARSRIPALTDEDALLAFRRLDDFLRLAPLTAVLGGLENRLLGADRAAAGKLALATGFDEDLVDSALVVRERVGMIDTLIHAAVIAQVLPLILEDGETLVKRPSLGAGNDPDRVFDLETSHRVAEFKLASWKGADGARQRSLFADVVGLSLDDSGRRREVYVVGSIPVRFLTTSNRNAAKTLSKAALRLRQPAGLTGEITVSAFTEAASVHVIDLVEILPRLR